MQTGRPALTRCCTVGPLACGALRSCCPPRPGPARPRASARSCGRRAAALPPAAQRALASAPRCRSSRSPAVVRHVDHPWDVQSLPGGVAALHPARPGHAVGAEERARCTGSAFPQRQVWVSGETGLMGLEVDPDFADQPPDLHLPGRLHRRRRPRRPRHRVDARRRSCARPRMDKVAGRRLPDQLGPARRLPAARSPATARCSSAPATPRRAPTRETSTRSAARRCASTGSPARRGRATRTPARRGPRRYVHTFGHRNVQGVAERADGTLWSIEQGTDRDDEVNLLVNGGDYGWNPVPGYNESVPMTDQSLPGDQVDATLALRQPDRSPPPAAPSSYGKQVGRPRRRARRRLPQGQPGAVPDLRRRRQAAAGPGAARRCGSTAGSGRSPAPRTATCWSPPTTAAATT